MAQLKECLYNLALQNHFELLYSVSYIATNIATLVTVHGPTVLKHTYKTLCSYKGHLCRGPLSCYMHLMSHTIATNHLYT